MFNHLSRVVLSENYTRVSYRGTCSMMVPSNPLISIPCRRMLYTVCFSTRHRISDSYFIYFLPKEVSCQTTFIWHLIFIFHRQCHDGLMESNSYWRAENLLYVRIKPNGSQIIQGLTSNYSMWGVTNWGITECNLIGWFENWYINIKNYPLSRFLLHKVS